MFLSRSQAAISAAVPVGDKVTRVGEDSIARVIDTVGIVLDI